MPRYYSDYEAYGTRPESFISHMSLWNLTHMAYSEGTPNPYMLLGLKRPDGSWASKTEHSSEAGHNLTDPIHHYEYTGDQESKLAWVGLMALNNVSPYYGATVFVQSAQIELSEPSSSVPKFGTPLAGPAGWVNETAEPIEFTVSDNGLGVYAIKTTPELTGTQPTWTTKYGCVGVGDAACPHTWSWSAGPKIEYVPSALPTGIDFLKLVAEDPLGHVSSTTSRVEVKVDHTGPEVFLGGTLTEQDSLGTRRASYTLKATAADGNAEHPQSGVAKAEVKLDGKAVAMEGKQAEEWAPKCTTQNCSLAAEWTLSTAGLADGKHTVEVVATDAVGISTTKTLTIETHAAAAPTLALSGSITEQATLGTSRPRYILKAKSTATAAGSEAPPLGAAPAYVSSIGSQGTGNGQFSDPADVGVDSSGNTWVLNWSLTAGSRLQEFNEKGEWVRSAGSQGSGAGQLLAPNAMAIDSQNNIWVADTQTNRIVEFNAKGEFVEAFGTNVNKTKVEAGGTEAEKNLCTAASGNVCQAATAGSLAGQLKTPKGIALTAGGNIWVADTGNNRLQKFSPAGAVLNTISGEGTEPGEAEGTEGGHRRP